MKNQNDKQTNETTTTEQAAAVAFALPDLSKPVRGVRVRSRLRAGVLASDETM